VISKAEVKIATPSAFTARGGPKEIDLQRLVVLDEAARDLLNRFILRFYPASIQAFRFIGCRTVDASRPPSTA